MTPAILALVFSVAGALASATPGSEELPRGKIIERVVCRSAPDQSYALYLPAGYPAAQS